MQTQTTSQLQHRAIKTERFTLAEIASNPDEFCFRLSKQLSAIHQDFYDSCAKDDQILRSVKVDWVNIEDVDPESENYNPERQWGLFYVTALRTTNNRPLDEYKDGAVSTISALVEA